ncbi:MAG: helix-turn-helix domain-containing protein [Planctomycetaceae bacterium]|nr:helix-turn-helix domain-containing protein [Planctomycetaceae bacterium]
MAQKYYSTQEAAKLFGISEDDVKKMVESRELHGYRDGASWKFKAEEIDRMAAERQQSPAASDDAAGGDVLLSEVSLGPADVDASGTVIAMENTGPAASDSDIQLAGSGVLPVDQSITPVPKKTGDSKGKFEELQLTLDEDLTLEDSTATLRSMPVPGGMIDGGSAINLGGKGLDDDDLVLGGSAASGPNDVSIGGDSGISLVDPADSGLSLEQPLGLANAESLELSEADMLAPGEATTQVKKDDEFLLTPLEETAEPSDSESGSQVIALDSAVDLSGAGEESMTSILEEAVPSQPSLDMGLGASAGGGALLGAAPVGLNEGAAMGSSASLSAESPYSTWQIVGLVACLVLLLLCGMMMYDLLRNMWSWQGAYKINSSLMDMILSLFERK